MKIYFCGAIMGDTSHLEFYKQIIPWLEQEYGEVLTRHIIADDPTDVPGKRYSDNLDEHIYLRDADWIQNQADLLIADLTAPSLGVGGEVILATKVFKIPTLAIRHSDSKIALFPSGAIKTSGGQVATYKDLAEAKKAIADFISSIK
jgi:hypothetical protein